MAESREDHGVSGCHPGRGVWKSLSLTCCSLITEPHSTAGPCSEASLFFGLPAMPLEMVLHLPNPPVLSSLISCWLSMLLLLHETIPPIFSLSCFVLPVDLCAFAPSPVFISLLYVAARASSQIFVLCEPNHQSRSLEPAVLLSLWHWS